MVEVDVAIVGSGLSALVALGIARSLSKKAIAIDPTYSDGGYLQILGKEANVPKSPLFISKEDAGFFENLEVDIVCLDAEIIVIKKNDYISKTLGFAEIDVQRNWFVEWVNSRKLCTSLNIFSKLKKALGFEEDKLIHIPSDIRKIDVEKKVIALTTGEVIKYKHIVYTWPLNLLHRYLHPENVRQQIKEYIGRLNLDYVSIYILSALIMNKDDQDTLKIYIHETKASRMHTAITLNLKKNKLLYVITSYSRKYPLLPGIYEKLLSELRKFRISNPSAIAFGYGVNMVYGLINKINMQTFEQLKNILNEISMYPFGRLGLWKDQTIKEILENKELQQLIT